MYKEKETVTLSPS